MNSFLTRYKTAAMLTSLGCAAMGLLMLIFPSFSVKAVCYAAGAAMMLAGAAGIVLYCMRRIAFQPGLKLGLSIAGVLVGLFFRIKAAWIVSFLQVVLAVMVIVNGALAVYESLFFKKMYMRFWWMPLIYGVLAVAAGIVALCNPFETALALTRVTGLMLLISGLADVLILYRVRRDMEDTQYIHNARVK